MKKQTNEYVILATKAGASKDQLTILGQLIAERFGIEGCKIITDKPTQDDVRGKVIVGGYLPSYLAQAAKSCVEINTAGFFEVPARMIKDYSDEEKKPLLKYPKAYSVKTEDVNEHLPEAVSM